MSIRPSGETADYRRGYEAGYKARKEQMDEAAQLRALAKQAAPSFRALTDDLAATPPAEAPAERGEWVLVPRALVDEFPEINPSNYDHDDACALNRWGCELVTSVRAAAPAAPAEGGAVFFAPVGLVNNCQAIAPAQDFHRVVLATKQSPQYPVPLYTTPRVTGGRDQVTALPEKWRGITTNRDIEWSARKFMEGYDKALNDCASDLDKALQAATGGAGGSDV